MTLQDVEQKKATPQSLHRNLKSIMSIRGMTLMQPKQSEFELNTAGPMAIGLSRKITSPGNNFFAAIKYLEKKNIFMDE